MTDKGEGHWWMADNGPAQKVVDYRQLGITMGYISQWIMEDNTEWQALVDDGQWAITMGYVNQCKMKHNV